MINNKSTAQSQKSMQLEELKQLALHNRDMNGGNQNAMP
ncbi:hypothetical protein MiTs_03799 [Microcystis aeruginosa NIES-2521]|uniref:Uncharacterized protein n=1 Tax=Microcystis aeruginosa NIES-2521 TaxID=2303983 RepID=A0A5A5S044_MICAE|nr:hypothetical protein MiTs_03799 [Microcystis aeruginosa NIES-2521]